MFQKALELMEQGKFEEGAEIVEGFLDEVRVVNKYEALVMKKFEVANPSVEVLEVELGSREENVPALADLWFKVTTKEHGWLHVYLNRDTKEVEWY